MATQFWFTYMHLREVSLDLELNIFLLIVASLLC